MHRGGIGAAGLLLSAALLLTANFPSATTSPPLGGPPPTAGTTLASSAPTALTFHSNLELNESGPALTAPVGEVIQISYGVQAVASNAAGPAADVELPGAVVVFATASGPLHLYLGPANLTVAGSAYSTVVAGPVARLATATTFNRSSLAYLSSQGVAVMASGLDPATAINVRWQWTLLAPDGSSISGAWSTPKALLPAASAQLAAPLSHAWPVNGAYTVCLAGPLSGRSFTLRLSVANSTRAIQEPAFTVASSSAAPACWSNTIPSSVAPQAAWVHLWDTTNSSYLLFESQVQITNHPKALSTRPSLPLLGWVGAAGAAGLVAAVLVARLRRRKGPGSVPPHVVAPSRPTGPSPPTR